MLAENLTLRPLAALAAMGLALAVSACSDGSHTPPERGSSAATSPPDSTGDTKASGDTTDAATAQEDSSAPIDYPDPLAGVTLEATQAGASTFAAVYGVLWYPKENKVLFSDIDVAGPNDTTVRSFDPAGGTFGVFRALPTGRVNGQALDPQGRVVEAEGTGRKIVRRLDNGSYETVAATIDDGGPKKFTAPNDVVVHKSGTILFTDPGYSPAGPDETGYFAIYRIAPDGKVGIVEKDPDRPNAIALSPDHNRVYIGNSKAVRYYSVNKDGVVVGAPGTFAELDSDGMTTDAGGNVYVAGSGGVHVFDANGKKLGDISVAPAAGATSVSFGDADRKTLYIGAGNALMKIRLNVPGAS